MIPNEKPLTMLVRHRQRDVMFAVSKLKPLALITAKIKRELVKRTDKQNGPRSNARPVFHVVQGWLAMIIAITFRRSTPLVPPPMIAHGGHITSH